MSMRKMIAAATIAASATIPMAANADTIEINGVTWTYSVNNASKKTVTLGGGTEQTPAIPTGTALDAATIPWTFAVDGETYTVTALADNAFQGCTKLTGTITIPMAVTSIGRSSFKNMGLNRIASLGGITSVGGYTFETSASLTQAFPDISRVTDYPNGAFYGSRFSGVAWIGKNSSVEKYRAFAACPNLEGVCALGPDTVASGTQSYTSISVSQFANNSSKTKVIFMGPNTKAAELNTETMLGGVTGCKVYVPDNGFWDGLVTGGTDNEVIYYGASTNLNLSVDDDAGIVVATPTDEAALVKAVEAAPLCRTYFGWTTKVNITNALEVTAGTITSEMLSEVELNSLMFMFKVNTQAQLDSILAAVPASVPLAIDCSDAKVELTPPIGRKIYALISDEGRNGKYRSKINGLTITFY